MLRAEDIAPEIQSLVLQPLGFGIVAFVFKNESQAIHRVQSVRAVAAKSPLANVNSPLEQGFALVIKTEAFVDVSHDMHHVGAKFGVFGEARINVLRGFVENLAGGDG